MKESVATIHIMTVYINFPFILNSLQWLAAFLLVPLACCQFSIKHSNVCRGLALMFGYTVQTGLFFLLKGAGFDSSNLVLFVSVAAYFTISTTTFFFPVNVKKPISENEHPPSVAR